MKSSNAAIFRNARLRDKNDYPRLAEPHERCCGCAACCAICPKNAIHMDANEEGFFILLLTLQNVYGVIVVWIFACSKRNEVSGNC